jgi:membrane-associated phospholipid phosphatase
MKTIFRTNASFLVPLHVFLIGGLLMLFRPGSTDISVWINAQHTPYGDAFFRMATWLGDGITAGIFIFVLLFIRFRWAFLLALAMLVSTFLAQWLKHYFNYDRPSLELSDLPLHYVEGVQLYQHFSFPSGHTTAAFCMYGMLAFISKTPVSKLLFFLVAAVVGISRIYLMQHFLEDVLFGAVLGSGVAMLVFLFPGQRPFLERSGWNKSLISLFRKK